MAILPIFGAVRGLPSSPVSHTREDRMLWIATAIVVVGAGYALMRKRRKAETGN